MFLKLRPIDRAPLHRCKGRLTQLHLLFQRATPGSELPLPLFCDPAPLVSLLSLQDGPGAGLPRSCQRHLGLLIVEVTLVARKGNGHLQLAPLLSKAQALGLKARVLAGKLYTELAHCISRPLEKPLAKSAALPSALEHVFRVVLRPWRA